MMQPRGYHLSRCLSFLAIPLMLLGCVSADPGASAASSTPASTSASGTSQGFARFVDTYFDSLYSFSPSQGTAAGFHQYDNKVEDLSAANITRRIATLHALQSQL